MYSLPEYKEQDPAAIRELIARYPFAFLTGCDVQHRPVATQVPMFIENHNGKEVLRGHIMKNTDHHKALVQNPNVLAVFTGHHTYVSGSWYSNPHIASTWNYMSVHVRGTIRFFGGNELEEVLRKVTLHFENNNTLSPTVFGNLPEDFLNRYMPAIAGFEIEIASIEHVFKLSQDRDEKSYRNIIEKLRDQDENGRVIAGEMEKRMKQVFP